MEVRYENVRVNRLAAGLLRERLAAIAEPRPAVEDVRPPIQRHFDAGSIPAVPHVFHLRRGSGAPHTPEFDLHAPPVPHALQANGTAGGRSPKRGAARSRRNGDESAKYMPTLLFSVNGGVVRRYRIELVNSPAATIVNLAADGAALFLTATKVGQ